MSNKIQTMRLLTIQQAQKHPFHVLTNSKLPIFMATFVGLLALVFVAKLHEIDYNASLGYSLIAAQIFEPFFMTLRLNFLSVNSLLLTFITLIIFTMGAWSFNLLNESVVEGHHTNKVQLALKYGMLLFLLSEAMLSFPFSWAFFHGSLAPTIAIGGIWPPIGIKDLEVLNPFMLPLVNTVVLLCPGIAVVAAHRAVLAGYKTIIANAMYIAISFGILFSWLQFLEYGLTKFTINDGLYGSVFFMLTGLHGFHVIVGTSLLAISYWRNAVQGQHGFSSHHHTGFELSAWYWHFVYVVWLAVFAFIYIWGI